MKSSRRGGSGSARLERACQAIREISEEIGEWLRDQDEVGEEAITDWLLWTVSRKLPFVVYRKFPKRVEAREGADWEWWFVSDTSSLGLRIQAKRLRPGTDHYRGIAYTSTQGLQIERLQEAAARDNLIPLYCLYHPNGAHSGVSCPSAFAAAAQRHSPVTFQPSTTLLIASAPVLFDCFIKLGRRRVEADDLVAKSNPLACFFCCPEPRPAHLVEGLYQYLQRHYPIPGGRERPDRELPGGKRPGLHAREGLPSYVAAMLGTQKGSEVEHGSPDTDAVVVFDLRGEDERGGEERPSAEERAPLPCALLPAGIVDQDARVRALAAVDINLGVRALAAPGVQDETVQAVLELGSSWGARREVYEHIPELMDDPDRALALLDRLRRRTTNGNDLYFLDLAVADVGSRSDGARPRAEQLRLRLYDHIPAPPEDLFRWVETPHGGRVDLWREIPAGRFLMGSPKDEEGRQSREGPRHEVTLKAPYGFAAVSVTNAQYAAFDPTHEQWQPDGVSADDLPLHPAEGVTWYEAMSFCRWLSATFPWTQGARLPTEEEWEYACRARSETRFWSGDSEKDLARIGWYFGNSDHRTHRVGEKPANPWGLYDLHGNVREWTMNDLTDYAERQAGFEVDPGDAGVAAGPPPSASGRVIRGGYFRITARLARSAYRNDWEPGVEDRILGFRVLLPRPPEL